MDLSSMAPREIADRLFNRVMSSAEAGDSADVAFFLAKAVTSYEMARPLDSDGLYHLALLHQTGGDYEASLAAAREVLDREPDHLLNLSAAAEAAVRLGDRERAEGFYRHLLEVFDAETAKGLSEYLLHSTVISRLRSEAEAFLGSR
jgi:tetratricopeptide (TPR) repeat protein